MADDTETDVNAAVAACTLAKMKVQTALDTIRANNHPVSVYRPRMQNAALAVANKTERGKPAAPQG